MLDHDLKYPPLSTQLIQSVRPDRPVGLVAKRPFREQHTWVRFPLSPWIFLQAESYLDLLDLCLLIPGGTKGPQQHPSSELDSGWSSLARPMLFRRPLSRHRCFSVKSASSGDRPYDLTWSHTSGLKIGLSVAALPGVMGSALRLLARVSVFCDWERQKA